MDIEKKYKLRLEKYSVLEKKQNETINFYSILRLVIFIATLVFSYIFYTKKNYTLLIIAIMIFTILFLLIAFAHSELIQRKSKTSILKFINEKSLSELKGQWKLNKDGGEDYLDKNHPYGGDLDIFGKNSLFKYINFTTTPKGRERLKAVLGGEITFNREEILERQIAIEELAHKLNWRQNLYMEGLRIKEGLKSIENLLEWLKVKEDFFLTPLFKFLITLLPAITFTNILLYYPFKVVPSYYIQVLIIVQILALALGTKKRKAALELISHYKGNIRIYENLLKLIESSKFNSHYLKNLKINHLGKEKNQCARELKLLRNIVNRISDSHNGFYIIINVLTLMDYHTIYALEKWKKNHGHKLQAWLEVIAHFEELSSLANINTNNPKGTLPIIIEDSLTLIAEEIAHPLIGEKAVSNSITLSQGENIALITGSNMSGKSTLLRTLGLNLILAYCGTKVAAKSFKCPLLKVYTCMRTGDDLDANISSFYAEILRVKSIIEAKDRGEEIFFLLDEIFKGTNSVDRHQGAEMLINQLSKGKALGLVSTHDLELCSLEDTNNKVKNYHFREYYKDNEIFFDYILRKGPSNTRNAIYLMRMAGIEI